MKCNNINKNVVGYVIFVFCSLDSVKQCCQKKRDSSIETKSMVACTLLAESCFGFLVCFLYSHKSCTDIGIKNQLMNVSNQLTLLSKSEFIYQVQKSDFCLTNKRNSTFTLASKKKGKRNTPKPRAQRRHTFPNILFLQSK